MSTLADLTAAGVQWQIKYAPPPTIAGETGAGWDAEITFTVPFGSQTTTFLNLVAGKPVTVTVGGASVTRWIPLQHPDYTALLAYRVNGNALGGQQANSSPWGTSYTHNVITVGFRSVPFAVDSGVLAGTTPFLRVNRKWASEYVTMVGNSFKFPSDNTPIKQDAGFFVPTTTYSITIFQAPPVNDTLIDGLVCNVNSTTFLGWPAGTCLFTGGAQDITTGMTGALESTLNYEVIYRSIPHNQKLRPNGAWEAPVDTYSGNPIYPSADLNQLIQ